MLLVFDVALFAVYHKFVLSELGPNLPILIIGFIFNVILVSASLMIAFYQRPVRWLVKKAGALSDYDAQAKATNKAEKAALALYGTIPVSTPPSYYATKTGLANYGSAGFAGSLPQDIGWQK